MGSRLEFRGFDGTGGIVDDEGWWLFREKVVEVRVVVEDWGAPDEGGCGLGEKVVEVCVTVLVCGYIREVADWLCRCGSEESWT